MSDLRVGVVNIATPTPLKPDGGFDAASARRLCKRWVAQGIDGVLLIGTMGEGPYLTDETRNAFVELALQEAGDRVTVFVSAADTSRARMQERALRYAGMGAHCVVLCLPGFNAPPAKAVADVKAVADACPAPCAYYETPENTGTALVLNELLDILSHRNIKVCKDSSGNALVSQGITAPDFKPLGARLLDGVEYRTPVSRLMGYDGVLHGGGALTGRWVRQIWDKAGEGRLADALAMDRAKAMFLARVYNRFSRPVQNIMGQKYALKLLGVFDHDAVAVNQTLDDAARTRIREAVAEYRNFIE